MSDQNEVTGCPHRELAVGWALHALEPTEESLLVGHLVDCAECTRVVAETEQVGAMLGLSIPQVSPSPELERRVLAVVDADEETPVVRAVPSASRAGKVARFRGKVLAAAAAVILVAAASVLGIQVAQLDAERDQAARQVSAMSEAMRRLADPASVRVPLVAEDGRPMGMVIAGPHEMALVATSLPGNRVTDQIYVLWGLGRGAPVPLTGFDVASEEPVLHPVPSEPGAEEFTGYAVSLEPGRHAPAAPTNVMASGQVES